jgi:AraC-like DNA-binding protein
LFYVLSGEGTIIADNKNLSLKKGTAIFINSGIEYLIKTPEKDLIMIGVNFDYTFDFSLMKAPVIPPVANAFDPSKLICCKTFDDASIFNKVLYLENAHFIGKSLFLLEKEFSGKMNLYELKCSSIMAEILVDSFRGNINYNSVSESSENIRDIIDYVFENSNKNLTNAEIAKHFNYHPNYISSLIKKHTSLPIHKYINNIRLMKATELLTEAGKSINEIALECGYYDTSHFVRSFKNNFSITPRQYRENFSP